MVQKANRSQVDASPAIFPDEQANDAVASYVEIRRCVDVVFDWTECDAGCAGIDIKHIDHFTGEKGIES